MAFYYILVPLKPTVVAIIKVVLAKLETGLPMVSFQTKNSNLDIFCGYFVIIIVF
jgi:hypothetical protein